jgi:hypothetical protein
MYSRWGRGDRYGHLFKSDDRKKAMDEIAADMFG